MQINGKEVKRVSRKIDELHAEVEYVSGKLGVVHWTDLEDQSDKREVDKERARITRERP